MVINNSTIIDLASLSPHQFLQLGYITQTYDILSTLQIHIIVPYPESSHCSYCKLVSLSPLQTHVIVHPLVTNTPHCQPTRNHCHCQPTFNSRHCPPTCNSHCCPPTHVVVRTECGQRHELQVDNDLCYECGQRHELQGWTTT